jgi:ribosomal protein S18 acetylase RimI-like enzyme
MNIIEIHQINEADVSELQNIGRQTFAETFSEFNSSKNLKEYLSTSFATEKLANELQNPESMFFFAFAESKLAGYLKINFGAAQTEVVEDSSMEIERIYVLKAFQGKKVGQACFEKAVEMARQSKCSFIWLGVWEKNEKALKFYRKNGFQEFSRHIFRIGDDKQTDFLMKRPV